MKVQDIMFSVILDDMSQNDYDEIIRFVKERGTGDIQTHTYDPNSCSNDEIESPFQPSKS